MTSILENSPYVALIKQEDKELVAVPAFGRGASTPAARGLKEGQLALVKASGGRARPLTDLGNKDNVNDVIRALAAHAQELSFTDDEEAQAQAVADEAPEYERKDLRKLTTFTIDGDYTLDFDDAISARYEGDDIRVWVHVADVAAYVRPGSALDKEAYRRTTSVYLPTLTIPMLPKALSTGICSLVPGHDRAAVTAEFLLRQGNVVERSFYRSLIRSDARLTYSHVEQVFLGHAEPGPTYAAALAAARQAALDRTEEEASTSSEVSYVIEDGKVVKAVARHYGESQKLIERLMVLANEQVASFLHERGAPTLYRTHATSAPERIEKVTARLTSLGIEVKDPSYDNIVKTVEEHQKQNGENTALQMLLWGLRPPANYARTCAGHDGLGISTYTHFTSPIRRYADLVVHRALLAEIGAEDYRTSPTFMSLPAIGETIDERGRIVKKLSRQADSICAAQLLQIKLDEGANTLVTGMLIGMSKGGCFIKFDDGEGMLAKSTLGGKADDECVMWTLPSGKVLTLGDEMQVLIESVDTVKGQVRLTFPAAD